jgi:hypothetical protein
MSCTPFTRRSCRIAERWVTREIAARFPFAMKRAALVLLLSVCACGSVGRAGQPAATAPPPLTQYDLRYRLIDGIGAPVFCDPYQYPVARPVDPAEVARTVADLRAQHADEFDAIVAHEHLDAAALSPSDNLRIAGQVGALAAVPLAAQGGVYAFHYQVVGPPTAEVTGTIDPRGTIQVGSRTPAPRRQCPICLAQWARIAAPAGDVPVTGVRPGMLVWTLDAAGRRVAAPVLVVGHTPAPAAHRVVHLVLVDGRSVDVSPGHPLPDGRAVGDLRPGDPVDGSWVASADLRPYGGADTWDLLPGGVTHVYWADGVPLRSTLVVAA